MKPQELIDTGTTLFAGENRLLAMAESNPICNQVCAVANSMSSWKGQ